METARPGYPLHQEIHEEGRSLHWQIYCPVTKGRITSLQTINRNDSAKDPGVARDLMKRTNTKALSSLLDR
jgi:hypothetical protein